MARKTRPIEMYVGRVEGNSGVWNTEYVNIPIDTPDDKIDSVATAIGRDEIADYCFVGVYSVRSIEDIEEEYEDDEEL
jgi:hypothetical protein